MRYDSKYILDLLNYMLKDYEQDKNSVNLENFKYLAKHLTEISHKNVVLNFTKKQFELI